MERALQRPEATRRATRLGYISTHFPRVSQTFIFDEVMALRDEGWSIVSFAMNHPSAEDLENPRAARASAETIYLKSSIASLLRSFVLTLVGHPRAFLSVLVLSLRSTKGHLPTAFKRMAHLLYACHVRSNCHRLGVEHLHAHDGKEPGSIAWLCVELDRRAGSRPLTWSLTVHGAGEFTDHAKVRLDLKAISANRVLAVCDFLRGQLYRTSNIDTWQKFEVVRCGIELERFHFNQKSDITGPAKIIIVGRLSPEKGHIILLRACKQLLERNVAFELNIVGDGPMNAQVRETIKRLGLGSYVRLVGQIQPREVAEHLRAADVFCLPSFEEGLPVSIMEAMAIGLPVVSTYVAGIPELAVHRETAMVVPTGNEDALADALQDIIENAELRRSIAVQARHRVEVMHDIRVSVRKLSAIFETVERVPDLTSGRSEG